MTLKEYIRDLIENMTREQASRVIEALRNRPVRPESQASGEPSGELPITERQKAYIKHIYAENDMDYDEEEISNMTRREASELISSHTGGGAKERPLAGSWFS